MRTKVEAEQRRKSKIKIKQEGPSRRERCDGLGNSSGVCPVFRSLLSPLPEPLLSAACLDLDLPLSTLYILHPSDYAYFYLIRPFLFLIFRVIGGGVSVDWSVVSVVSGQWVSRSVGRSGRICILTVRSTVGDE